MPDADRVAATLAGAKRIADGLQVACRIPDKTPDFTACGGPAAEAYWDYFTPARISSLLAAVEAARKLTVRWKNFAVSGEECADQLREAITTALAGKEAGDG